ncbi:MAG: fumarylacetoacetate hydrolase family protein, partial [Candidatus Jordarchaeaceae archaeon]
ESRCFTEKSQIATSTSPCKNRPRYAAREYVTMRARSFISDVMTLEPGDIIATGTPSGVGIYAKPEPRLLKVGDVMEASIEELGILRNPVTSPK